MGAGSLFGSGYKQVLVNSLGHGLRVLGQGNRPVHSWSKDQLQL